MLLRLAATVIIALAATGCMSNKVWDGADKKTAAILEHSGDFRMESIDGSWLRKKSGFRLQFGGSRWFLKPGLHGITFFYDNGATYTTSSVLLTQNFISQKKYRLDIHDKNPATGEIRFAIKPED